MKLGALTKKALQAALTRYVSILAGFVQLVAMARALSAEDYGIYLLIFGAVSTLQGLFAFGVPEGALRKAAEALAVNDRSLAGSVIRSLFRVAILCGLGCMVTTAVAASFAGDRWATIWLAGLWLAGWGALSSFSQGLLGLGRAKAGTFYYYALGSIVTAVVTLPAILVFDPSLQDLLVLSSGSYALSALAVGLLLHRERLGLPMGGKVSILGLAKLGVPYATARVFQTAFLWSLAWSIGITQGVAQAGVIGTLTRLCSAVWAPFATLRFLYRPDLVQLYATHQHSDLHNRNYRLVAAALAVALVLIAVIAVSGDKVLPLILGSTFVGSTTYLLILLGGLVGEAAMGISDEIVRLSGHGHRLLQLQFTLMLTSVGVTLAFGYLDMYYALLGYSAFYVSYSVLAQIFSHHALKAIE